MSLPSSDADMIEDGAPLDILLNVWLSTVGCPDPLNTQAGDVAANDRGRSDFVSSPSVPNNPHQEHATSSSSDLGIQFVNYLGLPPKFKPGKHIPPPALFSIFEPDDFLCIEEFTTFKSSLLQSAMTDGTLSNSSIDLQHCTVQPTATDKASALLAASKAAETLFTSTSPSSPSVALQNKASNKSTAILPNQSNPCPKGHCIVCRKILKPVSVANKADSLPSSSVEERRSNAGRPPVIRHVPLKPPMPRPWGNWKGLIASKRQPRSTLAYIGDRTTTCPTKKDKFGFVPIGDWIADDLLGTHQGDRRYLRPKGANTAKTQRFWVPGYIGVRTTFDASSATLPQTAWTSDYEGVYDVMVWDMQKATLVFAGSRYDLDEAAYLFDVYSLAYNGVQFANTNHRPSPELRQAYSDVPSKGKGIVPLALQLLWKADQLNWDACSGTPEEWDEWNEVVRSVAAGRRTADTLDDMVKVLMQAMLWLIRSLKEAVIYPSWRGQPLEDFVAAVAKADTLGAKMDHYHPERDRCRSCLINLKGRATGDNNRHGMHTAEALFRVLDWELISMKAVVDLAQGGDDWDKAAAEELELKKTEEECLRRLYGELRQAKKASMETSNKILPKNQTCGRCIKAITEALDVEDSQHFADYSPEQMQKVAQQVFVMPNPRVQSSTSTSGTDSQCGGSATQPQPHSPAPETSLLDSDDEVVEVTDHALKQPKGRLAPQPAPDQPTTPTPSLTTTPSPSAASTPAAEPDPHEAGTVPQDSSLPKGVAVDEATLTSQPKENSADDLV
eukprot:EG_transcript_3571